jgi:FAD/FMN-containing dehydrogenase
MFTAPFRDFVLREHEVKYLYTAARKLEREDAVANAASINSLCRGAIVLLSARVEAYIKEVGELALEEIHSRGVLRHKMEEGFFYYISQDLIKEMKNTQEPSAMATKIFSLIGRDGGQWNTVGPFPLPIDSGVFNKGFSNPKVDKIAAYFNRFGYSKYRGDMQRRMKAKYQPSQNMVTQLVEMRNKIAHGDPNATITPNGVRDMAGLVTAYCKATDMVFATWCRKSLCPIK